MNNVRNKTFKVRLLCLIAGTFLITILYASLPPQSSDSGNVVKEHNNFNSNNISGSKKAVRKSLAACQNYRQSYDNHNLKKLNDSKIENLEEVYKEINDCKIYTDLLLATVQYLKQLNFLKKQNSKIAKQSASPEIFDADIQNKIRIVRSSHADNLKNHLQQMKLFVSKGQHSFSRAAQTMLEKCTTYFEQLKQLIPEYPHMAALGYEFYSQTEKNFHFDCGGALISNRFVITAAHCVTPHRPQFVRMGITFIPLFDTYNPNFDCKVKNVVTHPDYKRTTLLNDVGLIELQQDVTFSNIIKPACLYAEEDEPLDFIITGWGMNELNKPRSKDLLKANVQYISRKNCSTYYSNLINITKSQICAIGTAGGSCMGDSGSPLQIEHYGMFVVVGVTANSIMGCGSSVPGIYTKIFHYLDWIEGIVWNK